MKSHPWFWGTLGAWVLLGFFFSAKGFIFSPPSIEWRSVTSIPAELNGQKVTMALDRTIGSLETALAGDALRLADDHWRDLSGGADLAPILWGWEDSNLLGTFWRVGAYAREKNVRIACYYRKERPSTVFRLSTEFPLRFLGAEEAFRSWRFPLRPPDGSFRPFSVSFNGSNFACWSQGTEPEPTNTLLLTCEAQGFNLRPYRSEGRSRIFLLTKGAHRLVGGFSKRDGSVEYFFWGHLNGWDHDR